MTKDWFSIEYFGIGWFLSCRVALLTILFSLSLLVFSFLDLMTLHLNADLIHKAADDLASFITAVNLIPAILFIDHFAKRYAYKTLGLTITKFIGWSIAWRWGLWSALINVAGLFGLGLLGVSFGISKTSPAWLDVLAVILVAIWVLPVSFYVCLQAGGLAFTRVINRIRASEQPGITTPLPD